MDEAGFPSLEELTRYTLRLGSNTDSDIQLVNGHFRKLLAGCYEARRLTEELAKASTTIETLTTELREAGKRADGAEVALVEARASVTPIAVHNLTDTQRRELNVGLLALGSPRIVTDGAALEGYRELGAKCAELEERAEKAEAERDEARVSRGAAQRLYNDEHAAFGKLLEQKGQANRRAEKAEQYAKSLRENAETQSRLRNEERDREEAERNGLKREVDRLVALNVQHDRDLKERAEKAEIERDALRKDVETLRDALTALSSRVLFVPDDEPTDPRGWCLGCGDYGSSCFACECNIRTECACGHIALMEALAATDPARKP